MNCTGTEYELTRLDSTRDSVDPGMQGKVRVTVLAAGFGVRPLRSSTLLGTSAHPLDFERIAPVNMDDIEVPAFLRYRS